MTQQVINVGTVANDGTGDPLRTAFIKVNANFAEIYSLIPTDVSGNPIPMAPLNSPHFTGDPQVPTPPAGDADQSVANTAWVSQYFAKLDSPHFTGDPQSATNPPIADNDQSLATTSWVKSLLTDPDLSGFAPILNPVFKGDPKAPTPTAGDNDTSIATTAFVKAAIDAAAGSGGGGGGGPTVVSPQGLPQGRLTLQTGVPVMTSTTSGVTGIFYAPYNGNRVPIFDGTSIVMTGFNELTTTTVDFTKNPSPIGPNKINDWFVWNDAGTLRICHGPDWTDNTTRSAILIRIAGLLFNNVAITNGPAAQRGTYVGTTLSNALSQLDWIYGAVGVPPIAGFFGVWNMYNRVSVSSFLGDTTSGWTYASSAIREIRGNTTAIMTFVSGMPEDTFTGTHFGAAMAPGPGQGLLTIGVGYDRTDQFSGTGNICPDWNNFGSAVGRYSSSALGRHFFAACEGGSSPSLPQTASSTGFNGQQCGLYFDGRF
jgi:hypothetical protein